MKILLDSPTTAHISSPFAHDWPLPSPPSPALALVYCTVVAIVADVPERLPMYLSVCVVWCGVVRVDLRLTTGAASCSSLSFSVFVRVV